MIKQQCKLNAIFCEYSRNLSFLAPDFAGVSADAFNAMVGNVDLKSDNQAGLAQDVLEAMLLGPPTTTPAIPTRTQDPDATTSSSSTTTEAVATSTSTTTQAAEGKIDIYLATRPCG